MAGRNWKWMPNYKVGIKLLEDDQLMNVFPQYDRLLSRIEEHRKQIKSIDMTDEFKRHYQYNMMYDNVFSIFGKRGTGKTSVAFSLQRKFERNIVKTGDMVIPIIIPEIIPAECSIMGWILGIFEEEVQKILLYCNDERREKRDYFVSGRNDLKDAGVKLRDTFDTLKDIYFSEKYDPAAERSYQFAVANSARQMGNYYRFSRKLMEFWDCLIQVLTLKIRTEQGTDNEYMPLIYFVFDDVDLAPERISELMSVITKYLSHPNLIVLTTADERMILEVVDMAFDKRIGKLPKEWRTYLGKSIDRNSVYDFYDSQRSAKELEISEAANMYVSKVFPPSTRYYLELFDTVESKEHFRIESGKPLMDELKEELSLLNGKDDLFFMLNGTYINFYLNFLGNTSRQISNGFIAIQELLKELTAKQSRNLDEYYNIFVHFIRTIIKSNYSFSEQLKDLDTFIHQVFDRKRNKILLYIDYDFIVDFLSLYDEKNNTDEEDNTEKTLLLTIRLFSLFWFVENIIVLLEKKGVIQSGRKGKIHGIYKFSYFLGRLLFDGQQKFRIDFTEREFLGYYEPILNQLLHMIENKDIEDRFDKKMLYLFQNYEYSSEEVTIKKISGYLDTNLDWITDLIGILSIHYGNIEALGMKEIKNAIFLMENEIASNYQITIQGVLNSNIFESVYEWDLKKYAKSEIKKFNKGNLTQCTEKDKENSIYEQMLNRYSIRLEDKDKNEYLSMKDIVEDVEELSNGLPIEQLVNQINEQIREECIKKLKHRTNAKEFLELFCVMKKFLMEWDQHHHFIAFVDYEKLLSYENAFKEDEKYYSFIQPCIEGIKQSVMEGRKVEVIESPLVYQEIKNALKDNYDYLADQYERDELERKGVYTILWQIQNLLDIAVRVNDEQEFSDAVQTAILVQIMKYVQKYYLYAVLLEKYERQEECTSVTTEMQSKDPTKPSYYYAMFCNIGTVMEKETNSDDEGKAVKNAAERISNRERSRYITSIMESIENEQNKD